MLSALRTLHNCNVIHRDLKSANIFLDEDRKQVKLGDMNVSKILKKDFARTQTGTPYYASPEVWRDEEYNARADIWSLGCVIFELCNLKQPFQASGLDRLFKKVQAKNIEKFDPFYSAELQEMVHRCLTLDYKTRPSARELLQRPIFRNLRSLMTKKKDHERKEEGHMQTKVKYKGQTGLHDHPTISAADAELEDRMIVMGNKKRMVKRWGKLMSENDSSADLDQQILGTIPVDMDFQSIAKKLPKPRYSFSREKKSTSRMIEAHRRSKSGIRLSEHDNREKLKRLRKRRLKLMGQAKQKAKRVSKARKGDSLISESVKTRKSRESHQSGASRRLKRAKKTENKRELKKESRAKKNRIKQILQMDEPIEKSLLREKKKQEQILSKIEMCHSQLVKQGGNAETGKSKSDMTRNSKSGERRPSEKNTVKQSQRQMKRKSAKQKAKDAGEFQKINLKKMPPKPFHLVTQFELNNSYNLLRPIESRNMEANRRTTENNRSDEPETKERAIKTQVSRESNGTGKPLKTSTERNPRRIIVDKITYTFSKKGQPESTGTRRNHANPQKKGASREMKQIGAELIDAFHGLPLAKGISSVPEISLDKGKVVLRQRRKVQTGTEKFLKLMRENAYRIDNKKRDREAGKKLKRESSRMAKQRIADKPQKPVERLKNHKLAQVPSNLEMKKRTFKTGNSQNPNSPVELSNLANEYSKGRSGVPCTGESQVISSKVRSSLAQSKKSNASDQLGKNGRALKRKKSKYMRTQTMSIGERINNLVDGNNPSTMIEDSKLFKGGPVRYLTKGYSQADNRVRARRKRKKKGVSQENTEGNSSKKAVKSVKSLNHKIKNNKNISVWQHRPGKQAKLNINVNRLSGKPNLVPSSLYSRRYLIEESILSRLQRQIQSSKHSEDIYKLNSFGMLNLQPKNSKFAPNPPKKQKKKPKSLTQIMIDYPIRSHKRSLLNAGFGTCRLKKEIPSSSLTGELSSDLLSRFHTQLLGDRSKVDVKRYLQSKGLYSQRSSKAMFRAKAKSGLSTNKGRSKHFIKMRQPKKNASKNEIGKRQRIAQMVTDASYFDSLLHNKELSNLSTNFLSKKSNKLSKRY